MPYIFTYRARIYYETHGNPTSPPLLLSHGYSSTSQMWQGQISTLSQNHHLILWDMRGHGKSGYPTDASLYSEDHTTNDMLAILDKVAPEQQAVVGGLSLGGYMSLAFYRRFPTRVAKLLIIDTGPGFKRDSAREAWNRTAERTAEGFERDGLDVLRGLSPERSSQKDVHRNAKGLALAARGMLAQRDSKVILSLAEVKVPSLVVVGSEDKPFIAASEYMVKMIPGAKKVVIQGAGHAANIDRPEEFNEAIVRFLEEGSGDERRKAKL